MPGSKPFTRRAIFILSVISPLGVFAVIWWPEFRHYYVPYVPVSLQAVERARVHPMADLFGEFSGVSLVLDSVSDVEQIALARRLLARDGKYFMAMSVPFSPAAVTRGGASSQLKIAALVVPEILMNAYRITGEEAFFRSAHDYILRWLQYERGLWLPEGYVWNDHAVAARVYVLAKFWRYYRSMPSFDSDEGRLVLESIIHLARFLAKPDHFTYRTNHGVMQNLALLHIAVMFPDLPGVDAWRNLAIERLRRQFAYYVNEEGVVMEHSAGYHEFGVMLLGMAVRYLSLLGIAPPYEWVSRYEAARDFLVQLRRPDGTLPMIGDTDYPAREGLPVLGLGANGYSGKLEAVTGCPRPREHDWRVGAGYAVWWDGLSHWPEPGRLSQTVVSWPDFISRAHQHADEMSVQLWAGGQSWWTNVGYWPYGYNHIRDAWGWRGSNAPHYLDEPSNSKRHTQLEFFSDHAGVMAADLHRDTADGYTARRQVIHVGENLWVVVDQVADLNNRSSEVIWTAFPSVRFEIRAEWEGYRLHAPGADSVLDVAFTGSDGVSQERLTARENPFTGWVVVDHGIQSSTALVNRIPASGWVVSVWKWLPDPATSAFYGRPRMNDWRGPEDWQLTIPLREGVLRLGRQGDLLWLEGRRDEADLIRLKKSPDVFAVQAHPATAYKDISADYTRFNESLFPYRLKVSVWLLPVWTLQEGSMFMLRRRSRRTLMALRAMAIAAWIGVGLWLTLVYFAT